jgi:Secretion system C-terminal sorting domain
MKLKFLSSIALFASLGLIYFTMSSDSGGKYNNGASCGSCHGNTASAATTINLTGLPTNFITGQTYNLTFTVANSTNVKSGFNILCSGGTFTAGTGSKTNTAKTQITHNATSTTNSFAFTWMAPATTTTVTFSAVGNAVNGNQTDDSGDQWKNGTYTVPGSFPLVVAAIKDLILQVYPNPASSEVNIAGMANAKNIAVTSIFGQKVNCSYSLNGDNCLINLSNLSVGSYIVSAEINGQKVNARIVKN